MFEFVFFLCSWKQTGVCGFEHGHETGPNSPNERVKKVKNLVVLWILHITPYILVYFSSTFEHLKFLLLLYPSQ